jgi:hypothetical protein
VVKGEDVVKAAAAEDAVKEEDAVREEVVAERGRAQAVKAPIARGFACVPPVAGRWSISWAFRAPRCPAPNAANPW